MEQQSAATDYVLAEALSRYDSVRKLSELIVEPLSAEDCAIQSMADASPMRWHLAHTTWFFETFLLKALPGYEVFDPRFEYLFNSYYNTVGKQYPRDQRGLISRPGLEETVAYRRHVDRALIEWLRADDLSTSQLDVLRIGLNHEQQHQELMFTDIKHVLSCNPLAPIYRVAKGTGDGPVDLSWIAVEEVLAWIGSDLSGFAFDNEQPKHRYFLNRFEMANRCVTNGEYLEFIDDGGYERPELWLSLGWNCVTSENWTSPLYWSRSDSDWWHFTLGGRKPIDFREPVCHVSYFEADAYARWAGCRLPTEHEWEFAVQSHLSTSDAVRSDAEFEDSLQGHWSDKLISEGNTIHPQVGKGDSDILEFIGAIGNLWQWTASQYSAYPGYRAPEGALGEYNGKFMCNQFVLRGGSCATPSGHIRTTYRNFFPPEARWQFTGIRLAK